MDNATYIERRFADTKGLRVRSSVFPRFIVFSTSGQRYLVTLDAPPTCTCPAGQHAQEGAPVPCKHVAAVLKHLARKGTTRG